MVSSSFHLFKQLFHRLTPTMHSDEIPTNRRERLAYIDFRVNFLGQVGRTDLEQKFGIKAAASTRDITAYRELASNNLTYDTSAKAYFRSDKFKPLFNFSVERVLSFLSQGFGGTQEKIIGSSVCCLSSENITKPSVEILSVIRKKEPFSLRKLNGKIHN